MATYAIGDIQGCYDPFRRLLDKIRFEPDRDRLWLTGDLVNRGPKSLKTLRFVKSLGKSAITVLGNHDLHLIALAHDIRYSGSKFDSLWKILAADDCDELLDWLRMQPLAHYNKKLDTLMVHAGIPPGWTVKKTLRRAAEVEKKLRSDSYLTFIEKMYGNSPDRWSGELRGYDRLRYIVNSLTRMRMLRDGDRLDFTHNGPPDAAEPGLQPWFDVADAAWRGTRIVFGHWSALGLRVDDDLVSVDSGCVWGRHLTAVKISGKTKIIQVRCKGQTT